METHLSHLGLIARAAPETHETHSSKAGRAQGSEKIAPGVRKGADKSDLRLERIWTL